MKRSWFGFALLMVILACALLVSWVMTSVHRPVSQSLQQAADFALAGDWEEARRAAKNAEQQWQAWNGVRLCFADHTPAQDIDSAFAELRAYSAKKVTADFAAACLSLKERVDAMGKAHGLSLEELF